MKFEIGNVLCWGNILLKNVIRFYNCFYDDGEYKLSVKENYVYGLLAARWSSFLKYTEISVSQMNQLQCIFSNKDQSINKQKTWEIVRKLSEKQVINIEYDGELIKNNKMDYEKILRISFVEFKGFSQMEKYLYDECIDDPFSLYFACLCLKFDGYSAKYERIAEQTETGLTMVKDKIKKLVGNSIIRCEKGKKARCESGKYASTSNTYYVVEKRNDDEVITETDIMLPDVYTYKNKTYKVSEIRDDIINKRKLYSQHYFYVHEHKEIDQDIYNVFYDSRKSLEKKGFDFSKMDAEWSNYLIRNKEEEKKRQEDNVINAVSLYGDSKFIPLDIGNIDRIDFEKVENFYYYVGDTKNVTSFLKIAGVQVEHRKEIEQDKFDYMVSEYKKIVKNGIKPTTDVLMEIRNNIV